ncbi:MAG: hypothetical protein A2469_04445 [Candidatus Magasanikbacteria bacterium RIFOXYC2_FULL_40_16]|uniref:Uncharacterized protein n=3 Tax=Candidatus Magasanikiibacteriota TaxID=1752731 RepID=A0A1F6NEC0_9BACT|nr:MAG: hypothetical protein A2224_03780 [Candidatus Magasanikbacteria bacterium RIFOXYA2_FULL_40_20]OGH82316.1 MAG: hypothetical protein A2373_02355 [Candidatus Magasanikbacteria bacterium RIFOXYB1_FULL_40_15]OGH86377.1 MAG: hypothetical protein A2301_00460 [Candidatus Magasanikbacteria bacterium RIFOXYB2_FULL_40_13]OGH87409.1 MAG: hypothetical protein A2206_01765 [Candidatus Magasanikbacteria bacterium RIFOXYA1_FULL_40_8]OGH89419.1 MAG: hypothetical protein A2469_04445 [Candidatus Magasanikba
MFKTENGLKEINKNTDAVPWYWGRKFWGVLVILSILPSLYYISLLNKSFLNTMAKYFEYIARGFYLILETKLKFELHITGRTSTYYIILYYIILGLLLFLTFRKKKINIIFLGLSIFLLTISTLGLMAVMFSVGD